MAVFIKFIGDNSDKFKGTSDDAEFNQSEGYIEVFSFSTSVSQSRRADNNSSADAHFSDISITKAYDVNSPMFAAACAAGCVIGQMELNVCQTQQGKEVPAFVLTLDNVVISGYSVSGAGGRPDEAITLTFSKIEWKRMPGNIATNWDLLKNTSSEVFKEVKIGGEA